MRTPTPRRPGPRPGGPEPGWAATADLPVWYAAYGSNLRRARLGLYLAGGRLPGSTRVHPGCRDARPPTADLPVLLPGTLYFARRSRVWGGGMAFLDPDDAGELPARVYLLTYGQLLDIAAQEMHRTPGDGPVPDSLPDLATAYRDGRLQLGPGRYENLLCAGTLDGHPVLTLTAPGGSATAELGAPTAAYCRAIAAGLAESHGWPADRAAAYLSSRPGAAGHWTAAALLAAIRG
ncbi:hypothetical protein KNE206_57800 [Kitasatospora sp. NE20-6]|uniref:histone deacetylase n=1 Tax=Kitasatospora sp. NE20-6 TaxID=2859066 RepID=UPI0034DC7807